MKLYCADIRNIDPSSAKIPGRSSVPGSAFVWSLLSFAVGEFWGEPELPAVSVRNGGAPYFPDRPDYYFSLSHTSSHVLCAVSDVALGADVEFRRQKLPICIDRLATEQELSDFDFWDLWTLRESFFKLTGKGSLRTLNFRRSGGKIIPPDPSVFCRLYGDIPGCSAAVCSLSDKFPQEIEIVPSDVVCTCKQN